MSIPDSLPPPPQRQRGFTLLEAIFFMVIVGVALGGLVSVLGSSLKGGADMVSQKQALAIAEALIEEIALKPYTYCDPDDANAATATAATVGAGGCAATLEGNGPESGETRSSFDNVNDYVGYTFTSPIGDHSESAARQFPAGFTVTKLTVAAEDFDGITGGQALHIQITVAGPGNTSVTLDTYRTRYAPNFSN